MELTRVKESNPINNIVALKSNKANGRMVRGFAIVALYDQIKQVEAHIFKVAHAPPASAKSASSDIPSDASVAHVMLSALSGEVFVTVIIGDSFDPCSILPQ